MKLHDAHVLAIDLFAEHGLDDRGWSLEFDNAKVRFGRTSYRLKVISLSRELTKLNEEPEVRSTLLHEIAHALTPGHHHDYVWRTKAREIGDDGRRTYSAKTVVLPDAPYLGVCPKGHELPRHRRPRYEISCGKCNPNFFDRQYIVSFKKVA